MLFGYWDALHGRYDTVLSRASSISMRRSTKQTGMSASSRESREAGGSKGGSGNGIGDNDPTTTAPLSSLRDGTVDGGVMVMQSISDNGNSSSSSVSSFSSSSASSSSVSASSSTSQG